MKKSSIIVATAATAAFSWAGVAGAQVSYAGDEENPAVVQSELPAPSSTETAAVQVQNSQQTLPVTGSNTGTLALAGAALVAGGGALVWRSRSTAQA